MLARSRNQPPRTPRSYWPGRQAGRGLEFCAACGVPDRPGPGPGPRPGRRRRRRHRRPGAGHRGRGAAAAAQCLARRQGLCRRIADLGEDCGHRVIGVVRKGARKAKIPLTAATMAALEAYLASRAHRAGVPGWRQPTGPCWPPPVGGSARVTYESWSAAQPAPPGSACGSSSRSTARATRRSPPPWTLAPPCATCRATPVTRTPHEPPV
jgi:hypothetical protein